MAHRVHVFTFKSGLLSRIAHDLRLRVERFEIRREGDSIHARFEPDSLRVDGVMDRGRLDPTGLGTRDKAKIVSTIQSEILHTRRHPSIEFEGTLHGLRAEGTLNLAGRRQPLTLTGRKSGDRIHASVEIQPSRHRIPPYKALAGAIRLQDRVRIELDLDANLLA